MAGLSAPRASRGAARGRGDGAASPAPAGGVTSAPCPTGQGKLGRRGGKVHSCAGVGTEAGKRRQVVAVVLGAQDRVLLCLFLPCSSFNSMKISQDKQTHTLRSDLRQAACWDSQAQSRGALEGHQRATSVSPPGPWAPAGPAGPGGRSEAPPATTHVPGEGNGHRSPWLCLSVHSAYRETVYLLNLLLFLSLTK